MGSPSAVVCREIFDENSQPSAEEISEYAQQLGIDPESESHLLPLARDGLMQALPAPWKAYYNEKLQTHYYYNEETKKTQWEHPLDKVYKELVKKARDASIQDDTCASVQELLTFEENPKILERVETKVDSDDDELTTDSSRHLFDSKHPMPKRLAPLGRPPLGPLTRLDKKLSELRTSPLRRSMDQPLKSNTVKASDRDFFRPPAERPKQLFKQQSEIIDLKINVLNSPEEDNFSPLLGAKFAKIDRGLPLTGKGSMFFKIPKSDNPSPDTDKSFPLDSASMTKSDPPKGILREKYTNTFQKKAETVAFNKGRHAASLEEDKKSVRFQLENAPEPSTVSPSSNSSSDQNEGQSSIVTPVHTVTPASKPIHPLKPLHSIGPVTLSPIITRPPIPPKLDSPKEAESTKVFETSKAMENSKVDGERSWMESQKESLVDSESDTSSIPSPPDPKMNIKMESPRDLIKPNQEAIDSSNVLVSSKPDKSIEIDILKAFENSKPDASSMVIVSLTHDNAKGIDNRIVNQESLKPIDVLEEDCNSISFKLIIGSPKLKESHKSIGSSKLDEFPKGIGNDEVRDSPKSILSPELKESSRFIDSTEVKKFLVDIDEKLEENPRSVCSNDDNESSTYMKVIENSGYNDVIKVEGISKPIDNDDESLKQTNSYKDPFVKVITTTSDDHYINDSARNDSSKIKHLKEIVDVSTSSNSSETDVDNSKHDKNSSLSSSLKGNPSEIPKSNYSCSKPLENGHRTEDSKKSSTGESPKAWNDRNLLDSTKDGNHDQSSESSQSPKRRVLRPPAADYIKPDLFQKNFQKISDLVRPGDINTSPVNMDGDGDKDVRPRSPLIPQQKNKISINLMESIESETSTDSPDNEFANLDLNDLNDSNAVHKYSDKYVEKSKAESDRDDDGKSKVAYSQNLSSNSSQISPKPTDRPNEQNDSLKQIRVPTLDLPNTQSDSEESRKADGPKTEVRENIDKSPREIKSPQVKSPKFDFNKPLSPLTHFRSPNKAVIAPLKLSDSSNGFGKSLSPRLDGVIISQGKSTDNVVVVYQFESQDENYSKPIKSPLLPDSGRDILERNKADERKRLEFALQKELESIRLEFVSKERRMRAELQEELRELEEKFLEEKRLRLAEQADKQKKELEIAIAFSEQSYQDTMLALTKSMDERRKTEIETVEKKHAGEMAKLEQEYRDKLAARREQLEIDNERALSDTREQLQAILNRERTRMIEDNKATIEALREDHTNKITELKHDYRAEVERLRTQHACHLEELRARFANERAARPEDRGLTDKYKCLKEKYARLKHDVKMSIERRNKRREMSMTTGSETEKSNSHKATQSLERCKELNETSVSAVIESEPRSRNNNLITSKYDNETSHSDSNAIKVDNNNDESKGKDNSAHPSSQSQSSGKRQNHRRTTVAFREPLSRSRDRKRDRDAGTTTDYQDSSDGTTADEKPKEPVNGHSRRRCFTRLKSASTSRLNYSPKRGEGWSSPLEALRQQLRKLDDLEDQLPDLACQPNYSLRYPFGEIGPVSKVDTPELEFVRHRALVEREGMRRARAVLKRRRAALKENRGEVSPHRASSEERETTELEVALHRARALLGEKEIRLRHIERALRKMADAHAAPPPPIIQEVTTSEASSVSETVDPEASGEVLRSLRALHADVRDIWRALDVRPRTASPEIHSFNPTTSSQNRLTVSAPAPVTRNNSDDGIAERARGLRAWLQTAPK